MANANETRELWWSRELRWRRRTPLFLPDPDAGSLLTATPFDFV